jgi:segregation and condensation protein A
MSDDYKVSLEQFEGPLDLLLHLVRKEEVEIEALPIARLTEQYLRHVERLEQVDLDRAGDYLVMAAQLLEWKARALLPAPPAAPEEADAAEEGRARLIQELLEYRALKERAALLGEKADARARRFERETERRFEDALTLKNVDIWDLVTAFQRLEKAIGELPETRVLEADDAPLSFFVDRLRERLAGAPGPVAFASLFEGAGSRVTLVATFLALLELVRLGEARARQADTFGEIAIERIAAPGA